MMQLNIKWKILTGLILTTMATNFATANETATDSAVVRVSVNPVMVTLDNKQDIKTLTVYNQGNKVIVMQSEAAAWSLEDNKDHYTPTNELIVTPPIFSIDPGEKQIVRVGLEKPISSERERAYRIFLTQSPVLPEGNVATAESRSTGVQMNVRLGIPVFINPVGERRAEIVWRVEHDEAGQLNVHARNDSNVHARIINLTVLDESGQSLAQDGSLTYVLPGTTRMWSLAVPDSAHGPYKLRVLTREGEHETSLLPN